MKDRPTYYSMLDPRWRWKLYDVNPADGPDYMGTAGCGPTTAAMLAAELTGDHSITPETTDTEAALGCLRDGGLVVCHVGPGRWTKGGRGGGPRGATTSSGGGATG